MNTNDIEYNTHKVYNEKLDDFISKKLKVTKRINTGVTTIYSTATIKDKIIGISKITDKYKVNKIPKSKIKNKIKNQKLAEFVGIWVDPRYRGKGISTKLHNLVEDEFNINEKFKSNGFIINNNASKSFLHKYHYYNRNNEKYHYIGLFNKELAGQYNLFLTYLYFNKR